MRCHHRLVLYSTLSNTDVTESSDFPSAVTEIVREQLHQLSAHKLLGPDGLHPRTLRGLAVAIAGPLSNLQKVMGAWEGSCDWKLTNVVPIYKKGMREDPRNYRAISLTSVPGTATEIILADTGRWLKNKAFIRKPVF